jgi:hypothetical protein
MFVHYKYLKWLGSEECITNKVGGKEKRIEKLALADSSR